MSKIYGQLHQVQLNLVAPKNEFNKFGNYNYRTAEGILEAVKPLLEKHSLVLTLSDDLVSLNEDVYIKATAKVTNLEGESVEVTSYAREVRELKGMQPAQITGSASSYARKYALNGLFCIDDTKDEDATNRFVGEESESKYNVQSKNISEAQIKRLFAIAYSANVDADKVKAQVKARYNKDIKDLTKAEYDTVCEGYESLKN